MLGTMRDSYPTREKIILLSKIKRIKHQIQNMQENCKKKHKSELRLKLTTSGVSGERFNHSTNETDKLNITFKDIENFYKHVNGKLSDQPRNMDSTKVQY